jgi:hypothetical protein
MSIQNRLDLKIIGSSSIMPKYFLRHCNGSKADTIKVKILEIGNMVLLYVYPSTGENTM